MLKDKKRNLILKNKQFKKYKLIHKPRDNENHEILESDLIKKLNPQPI